MTGVRGQLLAACTALEAEQRSRLLSANADAIDQAGVTVAVVWHFPRMTLPEIVDADAPGTHRVLGKRERRFRGRAARRSRRSARTSPAHRRWPPAAPAPRNPDGEIPRCHNLEAVQGAAHAALPGLMACGSSRSPSNGSSRPRGPLPTCAPPASRCTAAHSWHSRHARRYVATHEPAAEHTHDDDRVEHEAPARSQSARRCGAECTAFHKGRTTMVADADPGSADNGKLCAVVTQTQLVIAA